MSCVGRREGPRSNRSARRPPSRHDKEPIEPMTTTQAPPTAPPETGTSPGDGRRMLTDLEPLVVDPASQASNLVDLIHRAVERHAEREAMRWKPPKARRAAADAETDATAWVSRTYREMWDWVTGLSLGLQDLGLADGDSFCILSRTRAEWIICDLAGLALGAVSCPIYPQSEPGQAAYVINNVRARLVFVENAQQAAKIAAVRDRGPTPAPASTACRRTWLGSAPPSWPPGPGSLSVSTAASYRPWRPDHRSAS